MIFHVTHADKQFGMKQVKGRIIIKSPDTDHSRAPDKLRICVFYAMKTSKNACIIRTECTFTHTYCCVSKLSKFGAYLYAVDNNTSCT